MKQKCHINLWLCYYTPKHLNNHFFNNLNISKNILTKPATEEETGVAAWVFAALLCAFGNNKHNGDHDDHHYDDDDDGDSDLCISSSGCGLCAFIPLCMDSLKVQKFHLFSSHQYEENIF